jgi:hypothetical protein
LYEEEKDEKEKMRVAHQRTAGAGSTSSAAGTTSSNGGSSVMRKKTTLASSINKPKWLRFKVAHDLRVSIFCTRRSATDEPASPTVPVSPLSRISSFRSTSPEHHHSPYVTTSFSPPINTDINTTATSPTAGNITVTGFLVQPTKGTLRPSMLAFKLTDAVRSNFANAGFRATKKSKRVTKQHKELQSIGDATTSSGSTIIVVSAGMEGKKRGADPKYVPPQVLDAKPTPSGGTVMLPPSSRFSRASTLGTNMLETMSMRAPALVRATTTSCEISWEPWIVGNETKLKQFELSWRVVPGQRGVNSLEGWSSCAPQHRTVRGGGGDDEVEVLKRDQLHFEATSEKFTSIPQWDAPSSSSSSSSSSISSSFSS